MRATAILLASIGFAGSALAQLSPPATPAPAASAATTAVPAMIGGKFVVGYEGRGDYLKNEQLAKQLNADGSVKTPVTAAADTTADKSKVSSAVQAMNSAPQPTPATPAAAATSTAPAKLRSDASLNSDTSQAKAAAATGTTTTATKPASAAATPAAPQPTGPNYNPMVLIGGKIQR